MNEGPDSHEITERVQALLREHPPPTTEPARFWGAQFDAGLAWVHFPVGLGGLGAEPAQQEVVSSHLFAAGAPRNFLHNFVGIGMAAPTLVAYGTPEQQRLLRRIFTCEDGWCQLFSEPGAGSDLANVATTAERDGDEWVINGHKVWTSMAHKARYGILVARSDPSAPKHKGLTFFICDMQAAGVEVRPLRQISGDAEFNEVFLTNVRLPDSLRVGGVGEGWRVTIATLMVERAHNGENVRRPRNFGPIAHALRTWREVGGAGAVARDRLVRAWIDAEVLRLTALRAEQTQRSGTAGPEGSILKLATGVLPQTVFELCTDLLGPRGMLIDHYDMHQPDVLAESNMGDGQEPVHVVKAMLAARSATIGGGTTEIQKNTIGERVLGLPAEPRVDRS